MTTDVSSDPDWQSAASFAIDAKAKPPRSLGSLEEWAVKLSVVQRTLQPEIHAARLLVFAADHGITSAAPAVSAYPREVSTAVFCGIASGGAASAVLCAANSCSLNVVDVGLDADVLSVAPAPCASHVTVTHAKVCRGSASMLEGPAMTGLQLEGALEAGREAVNRLAAAHPERRPCTLAVCIGELGIGNTTAAAAVLSALLQLDPERVCGRGTGVDDSGLLKKQQAVTDALEINADLVASGPKGILQAVGGLEVAAMVGAYLQAAAMGMPTVVDGFISGVAALLALRLLDPGVDSCLFWSHRSQELGAVALLQEVGAQPPLDMHLRLGEGTGAVLAVPLLRSAAALMTHMAALQDLL